MAHVKVDDRSKYPGYVAGLGFIGRDFGPPPHECPVEGSTHVVALREERGMLCVGGSVDLVDPVEAGNSDGLHRLLLKPAHKLLPHVGRGSVAKWRVEDGAHLVFINHVVEFLLVEAEYILRARIGYRLDGELRHLSDFLVKRHL